MAKQYPDAGAWRRLAADCQLDPELIELQGSSLDVWTNILNQLRARKRLPALRGVLAREYAELLPLADQYTMDVARGVDVSDFPALDEWRLVDVQGARKLIRAGLESGDLVEQCHACERLCTLAENYFDTSLPQAVAVTSAFNSLDRQIRLGELSDSAQLEAAVTPLVTRAMQILDGIVKGSGEDRIIPTTPNGGLPPREPQAPRAPTQGETQGAADADAPRDGDIATSEQVILDFIVKNTGPSRGKLIKAMGLSKKYGNSDFCLSDISIELNRGEILGIVGVNASGKTTLLRMLLGEVRPSSGLLAYPALQEQSDRPNWAAIKRHIAYVSQALPRWPGRLIDNLQYVASIYGRSQQEIEQYLGLLLDRYDLDRFKNATWDEISGGYKTRFEIVRALLSNPDILILDEPLAYLDIISQQVVLRQLRQLAKIHKRPIGVIVTSQQLYEIESIADRLLVLDAGRTLFSGPVSRLSELIDDIVIEFGIVGTLLDVRQEVGRHPNCVILIATETGYIAVFKRSDKGPGISFNVLLEYLARVTGNRLSYVRDISNSCRLLFEPTLVSWLNKRRSLN